MGRLKLDADRIAAVCGYIRKGHFFGIACNLAGISDTTGFEWMARGKADGEDSDSMHAQFVREVDSARAFAEEEALQAVRDAMKPWKERSIKEIVGDEGSATETTTADVKGSWQAAAWYLERTRPERYGKRQVLQHEGEVHVKRVHLERPAPQQTRPQYEDLPDMGDPVDQA